MRFVAVRLGALHTHARDRPSLRHMTTRGGIARVEKLRPPETQRPLARNERVLGIVVRDLSFRHSRRWVHDWLLVAVGTAQSRAISLPGMKRRPRGPGCLMVVIAPDAINL